MPGFLMLRDPGSRTGFDPGGGVVVGVRLTVGSPPLGVLVGVVVPRTGVVAARLTEPGPGCFPAIAATVRLVFGGLAFWFAALARLAASRLLAPVFAA